jgi:hypothetical protein
MARLRTGVLGLFGHLDTTVEAIRRLKHEGYEVTAYSPTPRHEIEEALELPESAVRIFTLTGAFTGAAAGTALAVWASLDWPLLVGGKEIVSLPAFSVIIFETTVLIGALLTVAGLFLTARLPRIGKPEGYYHPSLSGGNFGVFAHVPSGHYDKVRLIMQDAGSEEVLVEQP